MPMRTIVQGLYKEKYGCKHYLNREEHNRFATRSDDVDFNKEVFDKLVARYPPIFGQWFTTSFPDPQTWLLARLNYTRTTAVMSMVGYLLGLGDRHAENIMFDASNGDTVHVDLNCIFNKGDTLR